MTKVQQTDLRPIFVGAGLPEPVREYQFAPPRKWRFDYSWCVFRCPFCLTVAALWAGQCAYCREQLDPREVAYKKVALEIQGGVWTQGRHVRGGGYEKDCEKLAEAQLLGWVVIWATPRQIENGQARAWIERALKS